MTDNFLRPSSVDEALRMRAEHPDYQLIAGGTDLLVASKDRRAPKGTIDLFGVEGMCGVSDEEEGFVRIGACTTYAALLASPLVAEHLPMLAAACREVGAAQIQSRGTIGGNVATSSPVGDTLPPLLALDAQIELASLKGPRRIAYRDFLTGYRKVDLAGDEVILAFHVAKPAAGLQQYWRKVGTRRAQSISKVMMAACGHVDNQGMLVEIRIALGAVADRTIRARATEDALVGKRIDEALLATARTSLRGEIKPIDDVRSKADYRLRVAENLLVRFLQELQGSASTTRRGA